MSYNNFNQKNEAYEQESKAEIHMKKIENQPNINFKNSKKFNLRAIVRDVFVIMLATISGGFAGAYYVNKRDNADNHKIYTPIVDNFNDSSYSKNSQNTIKNVSQIVSPAVVGINNKGEETFENDSMNYNASGIIYDSSGYIVTNYHTIKNAQKITVKLPGSKVFHAQPIGYDVRSDIAVIKIDAKNLPTVKFGDSSKVSPGDLAIIIGNPFGEEFGGNITAGIISASNCNIKVMDENKIAKNCKVLQTDASVNQGNSGGPLCNQDGEIIGITSLKLQENGQNTGKMNFVIPINDAAKTIDAIIKQGHVTRPYTGLFVVTAQSKSVKGLYVQYVDKQSQAEKSGIIPTDIIIEFDGIQIDKVEDFDDILDKHKIGDNIKCKVLRKKVVIEKSITLTEEK